MQNFVHIWIKMWEMENKIVTRNLKRQLDHVLLHEQVENGTAINNNIPHINLWFAILHVKNLQSFNQQITLCNNIEIPSNGG